jgi:phospholipid transport system substrate-binding protein
MMGGCFGVGGDFPVRSAFVENPSMDDWLDIETASKEERPQHPAARKIEALGMQVMAVLNDPSLTRETRERRFREMLARDLDIPVLARFMLGRHWKNTPPAQRKAYVEAFGGYLVNRYASLLGGGTEIARFHVEGVKSLPKGDSLVDTRIERIGKNPIVATWRMRERNGRMVIIDLMVEGFSMAQTQRQEFRSILRANNGRIEDLITALREDSA